MEKLLNAIFKDIRKNPAKLSAYVDLFTACQFNDVEPDMAHLFNRRMRVLLVQNMKRFEETEDAYSLYKQSLLFDAPVIFDSYLLYVEIERKPSEKFYQPRRKQLKPLVDALQDLADDKLDELFLSEPPRVGKTTMLVFYMSWLIGRDSEKANLYCAYSDTITEAFYRGVLEIIQDSSTYRWADVFPGHGIVSTNAQDELIDLDRKKRYPSVTCRSLSGTLNGACDCNGILISDDLLSGIEEAMSPDRLSTAWNKVDNNMLTRAKENAKVLWCGTRWSLQDPAGKRMDVLRNDESFRNRRYKIINMPALNENDESNFDYDFGVGFTTDYFRKRRASFERNKDLASWNAQYQGEPIEREGALFTPDTMRYFDGTLPDCDPDRVFMAVDPAWGGGDYVAAPICAQYGNDIFVVDVVYDNSDKTITQPFIAKQIVRYGVTTCQVECTKATESFIDGIRAILGKTSYRCNIYGKTAPIQSCKDQRIFDKSPDIRNMMIFRESGKRSKPYELFMQNIFSFKMFAKNKHDDAPDSLGMAIDMVFKPSRAYSVFRRPF